MADLRDDAWAAAAERVVSAVSVAKSESSNDQELEQLVDGKDDDFTQCIHTPGCSEALDSRNGRPATQRPAVHEKTAWMLRNVLKE